MLMGTTKNVVWEPFYYQWKRSIDFTVIKPAFSKKEKKSIYVATSSGSRQTFPHFPFDSIVKLNVLNQFVHTQFAVRRKFVGEPIFNPKGDEEDDGYLLVVEVSNVLIIYFINKIA